ncbi:MAG: glycosyl hydrolase [Pseudonocardia sp.]
MGNVTTWPNRGTWEELRNPDIYGAVSAAAGYPTLTIGIAMLPTVEQSSFAQCATGSYDRYFRDVGSSLVRLGRGEAIVRLGWEANGDWYAWSMGDDVDNYKACFRREAQAMRSTAPDLIIDWNMNKESKMSSSVADAYPGDDVVDIVGVDFYDMYPGYSDQAAWDGDYMATQNGGPRGLGTWLEFARSHGKKLSVPEWGLNTGTGGGTDSAFYIEAMHKFFVANSADIAYETYFNLQSPGFMIYPAGINPDASATYQDLWCSAL